jgi:2-(1,2-epoxy-1,2-dihydrophenyl)acetyl-CoA isomerase
MYQTLILTTAGPLVTVKLNRPEKLNAFGGPMREELLDVFGKIAADDAIRVVIVTGEGRGFSAGGDIEHLKQLRETKDEEGFRSLLTQGREITRTIRSLPKPVIAAVNGPCAGAGLSFALACDIRIASNLASFGPSFALIGLHPDWGGSWFLPNLLGTAKACELIFTGAMISAEEADKIGLVNRMVEHDQLIPVVTELAEKMAKNPAGVLRLAKESIYRSVSSDLETAFARENDVQMECFYSDDFLERITAFLQRRHSRSKGEE